MDKRVILAIVIAVIIIVIIIATSGTTDTSAPTCDKTTCNASMYDWIVNKYWAFGDSKGLNGCSLCESRGFTAPYQVKLNKGAWQWKGSKQEAYDAVKFL